MRAYILALALLFLLAACSAPPEDATRAVVLEDEPQPAEQEAPVEETPAEEEPEGVVEQGAETATIGDVENPDRFEYTVSAGASSIGFEGYGPGKSHEGEFRTWSGVIYEEDGEIIGGKGTIQMDSVRSDSVGLDRHLKNEDFFDVVSHPTSSFELTSIDGSTATGDFTFLGVTKTIEIPVDVTEDSISADFILDFSQFGMSYTGVNDEVRIFFTLARG